jgi:hypothetical protein
VARLSGHDQTRSEIDPRRGTATAEVLSGVGVAAERGTAVRVAGVGVARVAVGDSLRGRA